MDTQARKTDMTIDAAGDATTQHIRRRTRRGAVTDQRASDDRLLKVRSLTCTLYVACGVLLTQRRHDARSRRITGFKKKQTDYFLNPHSSNSNNPSNQNGFRKRKGLLVVLCDPLLQVYGSLLRKEGNGDIAGGGDCDTMRSTGEGLT